MKRGMLAVLCLVLLTSAAWGADWYHYHGKFSWNLRDITGPTSHWSPEFDVLVCYDTIPWSISFEMPVGDVWWSGDFDREGTKVQFRASSGTEWTFVGRGSTNAAQTTLNLQGSVYYRSGPTARSRFGTFNFRGKFVDIISR